MLSRLLLLFFFVLPFYMAAPCNNSQYVDPVTQNCSACPQNCSDCYFDKAINSVYCSKCIENNGIRLLPEKTCILCPPGCSRCFYYGALNYDSLANDLRAVFGVKDRCMVCPIIQNVQLTFVQV